MYRNNLIKILVLLLFIVTSSVTAQDYTEENLPAGKGIKEERQLNRAISNFTAPTVSITASHSGL